MIRRFTSHSESPSKRFKAFEFDADDELVEKQSAKMIAKFRNLTKSRNTKNTKNTQNKNLDSPVTKYKFLQCFSKNLDKEFRNEPIDVDARVAQGTKIPQKEIRNLLLEDDAAGLGGQWGSSASFPMGQLAQDSAAGEEMPRLDVSVISSSPEHENKQVCTISDDDGDDRLEMRSSSTLDLNTSTAKAPLTEQEADPGCGEYRNVETAMGNLHLESRDSGVAGNGNKSSGQEAINSFDKRYGDICNHYSDFSKPFEDITYPPGDPDAVCISKMDLQLLQPETFINDTIVDFYIQYLKSEIQPEEKHRFHFFNSFFFRKLADLDKNQSSACEGKAEWQRVLKWSRKVNVFQKDYIFIPVNYGLHWSLIVICHPGEVTKVEVDDMESSPKVPCILHMDSIKGSHRGLKNLFQRYLYEEWKGKHGATAEDGSLKFLNLRFFALELPQQENSFDCGLFLLHYVERFLEEAPVEFSPFKITNFSNFLNKNWFPPADASVKRFQIKKLICRILEDHSRANLIADCISDHPSSQWPNKTHKQETGEKLPEEMSSLTTKILGNSSSSNKRAITASPPVQIASCNLRLMSPLEEVEDTGDEISDSPIDKEDRQQGTGLASDLLPKSDFGNALRVSERCWSHGFPTHTGDNVDGDSISGTSSSGPHNSAAVGIDEDCLIMENEAFNYPTKTDKSETSSSEDFTACVVLDSQEENDAQDNNEVKYFSSSLENQETDSTQNSNPKEISLPLSSEYPVSESADQQASKRPRLTLPVHKRRFAGSLMRKLRL